jgi:hypothetical protein
MVAEAIIFPHGGGGTYIRTFDDLRTMDQLEGLRGCEKRLTACMLNRLGDLRQRAYALPAGFTTHAFNGGAIVAASIPWNMAWTCR